jgi:hypothetical protein
LEWQEWDSGWALGWDMEEDLGEVLAEVLPDTVGVMPDTGEALPDTAGVFQDMGEDGSEAREWGADSGAPGFNKEGHSGLLIGEETRTFI